MYGAGDLINDYEGFANAGDEAYNKLGALFVVDVAVQQQQEDEEDATGCGGAALVDLRLVPTFMDRLQLKRVVAGECTMWDPSTQTMLAPQSSVAIARRLCDAINRLSAMDVGAHGHAVHLDVVDDDPAIPGGPILALVRAPPP